MELKRLLEEKLDKGLSSRVFLDKMRLLDEDSRLTAAYNDPRYIPFYYFLGTFIKPKKMIEIGFRLGLSSGNFLKSCKTVERFVGFQEKTKEYYSPRLGRANVKDNYKKKLDIYIGSVYDFELDKLLSGSWDLVIINEEVGYDKYKEYLEFAWAKLGLDGLIVMEYVNNKVAGEAYEDFCKGKNRDKSVVNTRYGTGLIIK